MSTAVAFPSRFDSFPSRPSRSAPIDWLRDDEPLIRWACRACGSTSVFSVGSIDAWCRGEVVMEDGEPAVLEDEHGSPDWEDWTPSTYCCGDCGDEARSLSELLAPYALRIGDLVLCPDGYEGRVAVEHGDPGWVVPVVNGIEYSLQELQPATGPLPTETLFDLPSRENNDGTGPMPAAADAAASREVTTLAQAERLDEGEEPESYWELGSRKYFEGVFEARIAEDGLRIPQDQIDRCVRCYTAVLAKGIEDMVEGFMAFDFGFDFDAYRA